jgi:hypothetical protein
MIRNGELRSLETIASHNQKSGPVRGRFSKEAREGGMCRQEKIRRHSNESEQH